MFKGGTDSTLPMPCCENMIMMTFVIAETENQSISYNVSILAKLQLPSERITLSHVQRYLYKGKVVCRQLTNQKIFFVPELFTTFVGTYTTYTAFINDTEVKLSSSDYTHTTHTPVSYTHLAILTRPNKAHPGFFLKTANKTHIKHPRCNVKSLVSIFV